MRGAEFVVAANFRLGLNIYDKADKCPSCGKESDELGDHGMVFGTGGESISRHNALRDAIFDTAASAGLAPLKEERALLPGNNRRHADILLRHWFGGKDAALDVTITHPLKSDTRALTALSTASTALTPGHAASVTLENKMRGAAELCRAEGLAFVPWYTNALRCFSFNNSLFPSPTVLARNVLRQKGRGNGGAISVLSTPKTWCDLRAIHTKSWCE